MDYVASKGTTALGIIGTTLGGLAVAGGTLMGKMGAASYCSDDHTVNRYDAAKDARIAQLETDIKFRDSELFTRDNMIDMYKYVNGELQGIKEELCNQKVLNQRTADSFALAQADLAAVKKEFDYKLDMEKERRCCADNTIVNYANATFYPKMVADITTGTTTSAQNVYNPLACPSVQNCNN